jgi:hypothetical protein
MNTVGPYHNRQETYGYYTLPFCMGPKESIGNKILYTVPVAPFTVPLQCCISESFFGSTTNFFGFGYGL